MLWALSEDPDRLSEYHMRSISETGFSMLNRVNPPATQETIGSKEGDRGLPAWDLSTTWLCYLTYLADIDHPILP
jgi:hypothetical protein